MIRLHPIPEITYQCPKCFFSLKPLDWLIPGMRNLGLFACDHCQHEFYVDLPSGHGLLYPMVLDKNSGVLYNSSGVTWFAEWLENSYRQRKNVPLGFVVENFSELKQPLLVNCLDTLYGHCLEKLLNVQYYLMHQPLFNVIVLIPQSLRWMVPDGVSAIWTVDWPLSVGIQWNEWLAQKIKSQIRELKKCWLACVFPEPHVTDFNLQNFIHATPFPVTEWKERMEKPTITFLWRSDRFWGTFQKNNNLMDAVWKKLNRAQYSLEMQRKNICVFAQRLQIAFKNIDFAVVGLGDRGGFPEWIKDLRELHIDRTVEQSWIFRYSRSHLVVGVHGSNMLLPSAYAGAVIDLIPGGHWGNLSQDVFADPLLDVREIMFRYRFYPSETSPEIVADSAISLLKELPEALLHFKKPWCNHTMIQNDPWFLAKEYFRIKHMKDDI